MCVYCISLIVCVHMYLITITLHSAVLCLSHLCMFMCMCMRICAYVCLCMLQIIHLKRFQFFNGRWVKSQRSVRFPSSDLDPLRYTVQNGNEHRQDGCGEVRNRTETAQTGTGVVQNGSVVTNQQILPCGEQPPAPAVDNDLCSSLKANRGESLQISSEVPPNVTDQTRSRSTPNHQRLTQALHQREGHTYNLFAITVRNPIIRMLSSLL